MAYRFAIDLPGTPSVEVLQAFINAVVIANAQWYLDQWRAGRDPPCCCSCAGVLWLPDSLSSTSLILALPHAFDVPAVSCQTAAGVHAGHEAASDIRDGCPWDLALLRHSVELHPTGDRIWHAYARDGDELVDVAAKMERATR